MRKPFYFLSLLLGASSLWSSPPTQAPQGDLAENSGLVVYPGIDPGDLHLSWWGYDQNYYFVETSEDLEEWILLPVVELGEDEAITLGFSFTADRLFWRLRYSDDPDSDLLAADYNDIGITAWDQLQLGFNPFEWVNTDENDFHDAWELHYFDILGVDPDANPDNDGLTNYEEFLAGTDPTTHNSLIVIPDIENDVKLRVWNAL